MSAERVMVIVCESCEHVFEPDDAGPPAYECSNCGPFVSDDGSRCPECMKFSAKEADGSCPECDEPTVLGASATMFWTATVGNDVFYAATEPELATMLAEFEADNAPEAVDARTAVRDAHLDEYRERARKRHAEYMAHVPSIRRVLEACDAPAHQVEDFTADNDFTSSSSTIQLDMPVFLRMVELARETVARDER